MSDVSRAGSLFPLAAIVVLPLSACGVATDEVELAAGGGASPTVQRIALSTGVELEYHEQGRPDGDPVIFIAGYTDSHHTFERNLPSFPRRYHLYAPDMRGHGDSSKPACCYTHADFAGDVIAFMDAMGLERASIVGASMGSFIAHEIAVTVPERIDRLVLITAAPTAVGNPLMTAGKQLIDTFTDPIDPEFVRFFIEGSFYRRPPQDYLDLSVEESLKVPAHVWQQALDALLTEDHTAQLSTITSPTLIIHGEHDDVFTVEQQLALQAAIPGSRLHIYADAGHGLYAELPRRTNCDVARFLDGIEAGDEGSVLVFESANDTDDCERLTATTP